jgi:hypothetical protein
MDSPMYDVSLVWTLASAMGTSPNAHDYVITDTSTGRVRGIYATKGLAAAAVQRLVGVDGLFVLTVLHPARCACPEAA